MSQCLSLPPFQTCPGINDKPMSTVQEPLLRRGSAEEAPPPEKSREGVPPGALRAALESLLQRKEAETGGATALALASGSHGFTSSPSSPMSTASGQGTSPPLPGRCKGSSFREMWYASAHCASVTEAQGSRGPASLGGCECTGTWCTCGFPNHVWAEEDADVRWPRHEAQWLNRKEAQRLEYGGALFVYAPCHRGGISQQPDFEAMESSGHFSNADFGRGPNVAPFTFTKQVSPHNCRGNLASGCDDQTLEGLEERDRLGDSCWRGAYGQGMEGHTDNSNEALWDSSPGTPCSLCEQDGIAWCTCGFPEEL